MGTTHHQIVIIGGGAAGITVAARLKRLDQNDTLDIAIIEPSTAHYYQPAFTLVGGGACKLETTQRAETSLVPSKVTWIKDFAAIIDPEVRKVGLTSGGTVTYDFLVVCPGLELNWHGIEGLPESIGKNGVCSNYSPDTVEYTWHCLKNFPNNGTALFTQPSMPIKCPGAPQKIAYLFADYLRKKGALRHCELHFLPQGPAMFSVPFFAPKLKKVADAYGINVHFQHNLTKIDGAKKLASFDVVGGEDQGKIVELSYDVIHATPPQRPFSFVKDSPLSNEAGWVNVNQNSMQSADYPNVFSLGDACSTPNSKTAAAVRKQAPVVVRNLMNLIQDREVEEGYDGYGSCPLTTAYGKVMLAEFTYGGKVTPTFPLDPGKEHRSYWWVKKTALPIMYWDYMLKGYEWFPEHNVNFAEPKTD